MQKARTSPSRFPWLALGSVVAVFACAYFILVLTFFGDVDAG
jgi:hypothetical protein